jgi:glutamate racemase
MKYTDIDKIKNSPIGFFDSGVGGLSVYSKFKKILPNENTIYYGDLKNMPYGNKSKEELLGCSRRILNFFKGKEVKAVVIACNTSSAIAYETIKNEYDFKIYPITQTCAKTISGMNIKNIGVFATLATINSHAYKKVLQKYSAETEVSEIPCQNWTSYIENGMINTTECYEDVKDKMKKMLENNPDKIILGCTHYPYLLDILSQFAPKDMFIDPAEMFVEYIKKDLTQLDLLNLSGKEETEEFYVSANPNEFVRNAKMFYEVKTLPAIV